MKNQVDTDSKEKKIYVVIAGTIQIPSFYDPNGRTIVQPAGRQIAQACHVTSELRLQMTKQMSLQKAFDRITTIILHARDSAEMGHVFDLLKQSDLNPVIFGDDNPEYGPGTWPTAIAVYASKDEVKYILDYLPLWSPK